MSDIFKASLVRISLSPNHWSLLHDLADENRLATEELISDWLSDYLQKILDATKHLDNLQDIKAS